MSTAHGSGRADLWARPVGPSGVASPSWGKQNPFLFFLPPFFFSLPFHRPFGPQGRWAAGALRAARPIRATHLPAYGPSGQPAHQAFGLMHGFFPTEKNTPYGPSGRKKYPLWEILGSKWEIIGQKLHQIMHNLPQIYQLFLKIKILFINFQQNIIFWKVLHHEFWAEFAANPAKSINISWICSKFSPISWKYARFHGISGIFHWW